jgi:hypothetical protein
LTRWQTKIHDHQAELLTLESWAETLDTENLTNPNPPRIMLRVDAGFSTGANLTWLIEMGYTVLTKIHQPTSTDRLRRQLAPQPIWTRVGHNAEAIALTDDQPHDCPYSLQAMLVRYHLPDHLKYTTLLFYDDAPPPALPDWFRLYNARQIIEAGIKQLKGVFTLKRHLVRSPIGMHRQEQFARFSANFLRWATAWVNDFLAQAHPHFKSALNQIKTLVRVVAHAKARWSRSAFANLVIFDDAGPFAGTIIRLAGQVAVQLPLPLFNFGPPDPNTHGLSKGWVSCWGNK